MTEIFLHDRGSPGSGQVAWARSVHFMPSILLTPPIQMYFFGITHYIGLAAAANAVGGAPVTAEINAIGAGRGRGFNVGRGRGMKSERDVSILRLVKCALNISYSNASILAAASGPGAPGAGGVDRWGEPSRTSWEAPSGGAGGAAGVRGAAEVRRYTPKFLSDIRQSVEAAAGGES